MNTITVYIQKREDGHGVGNYIPFTIGYSENNPYNNMGDLVVDRATTHLGTDLNDIFSATNYPSRTEFDVYLDRGDRKLGFDIILSAPRSSSDGRRSVMLYSPVNGAFVYYCLTDVSKHAYLFFTSYAVGNWDNIRTLANKMVEQWTIRQSAFRSEGVFSGYKASSFPLNMCLVTDPEDTSETKYQISGNPAGESYLDLYQRTNGLFTGYNWYTFLLGQFKIQTFWLETEDDRKIYLTKILNDAAQMNDFWRINAGTDLAQQLYNDTKAVAMWDYQLGSPLCEFFNNTNDYVILKNGATLSLRRINNENWYLSLTKGDYVKEWYIGQWFGNFNYSSGATIHSPKEKLTWYGIFGITFGSEYPRGCGVPTLTLNGKYNNSVAGVLNNDPAGDYTKFYDNGVICPTIEVCTSYGEMTENWGFDGVSRVSPLWCDVAMNVPNSSYACQNIWWSECQKEDTTFETQNRSNVDSAELWSYILGVKEFEEDDVNQGGGSIGGGGSQGGGQGGFNDNSDTIGLGSIPSIGTVTGAMNWYIGEYGSPDAEGNMTHLANWLAEATWAQGDITYTYNDKLANICSLKVIFSPGMPHHSSAKNIKVHGDYVSGTLDAGHPMQGFVITNNLCRFHLNDGYTLDEYFGSFLDYESTKIQIYLPFAGVHELEPSVIVGKEFQLWCTINFLSGDILYEILVNNGQTISVIYSFDGNCAMDIPITSQAYSTGTKIANGLLGAGTGAIGGALAAAPYGAGWTWVGGAVAGAIGGAASAAKQSTAVNTRGTYGGCVGAMGVLHPYLIVTRPKQIVAENYAEVYGWPSNQSILLSKLTGYVKVAECNWTGFGTATEEEIDEIDRLMKTEGAIL